MAIELPPLPLPDVLAAVAAAAPPAPGVAAPAGAAPGCATEETGDEVAFEVENNPFKTLL